MRSPAFAALVALSSCTPPEPGGGHRRKPHTEPDTDQIESVEVVDSEPTGTTGDTAPVDTAPEVDPDCAVDPPPGPFEYNSSRAIQTEEDFDFDAEGYLLSQRDSSLQGFDREGVGHIVVANIGVDAAGIRSLSTGDIMIAQPDLGAVGLVDSASGSTSVVLGGLAFPNGLEATSDGWVFSSEFNLDGRIQKIEPYTGQIELVAQLSYPNNMALSPDEQTLYVITSSSGFSNDGRIMAIDRNDSGGFDEPRLVREHNTMLGGITTDKCGNVYAVEYYGGRVFRIRASDGQVETIALLPQGSLYSSARFAPGLGGWERTELFVTNRSEMFVIDVQIEGRHVLAR